MTEKIDDVFERLLDDLIADEDVRRNLVSVAKGKLVQRVRARGVKKVNDDNLEAVREELTHALGDAFVVFGEGLRKTEAEA